MPTEGAPGPETIMNHQHTSEFGAVPDAYRPDLLHRICTHCHIAGHFDELRDTAERIVCHRTLREYADRLFAVFSRSEDWNSFADWPAPTVELGGRADQIFLLTVLSGIPEALRRYREQKISAGVVADTLDFAPYLEFHRSFTGSIGLFPFQVSFGRNFYYGLIYRLGRFQFKRSAVKKELPAVIIRRRDGVKILLSAPGAGYDQAGFRADRPAWTARLETTPEGFRGHEIAADGTALSVCSEFPAAEWEWLLPPGAEVLDMHIPPGEKLTPAACRDSWRRAFAFFRDPPGAIHCDSWLCNPRYRELLPESNLARLTAGAHLFPTKSTGRDGLFFLFGSETVDVTTAPRDTALRRTVLAMLERSEPLRGGGMLIFPDEIQEPFSVEG